MDRDTALARMVQLYESGLLAPFLGAGMSRPCCPDWFGFVETLVKLAHGDAALKIDRDGGTGVLVQVADRAVVALKHRGREAFQEGIRAALTSGGMVGEAPAQARALGRIWWPLVLSTNYDDWFLWSAFRSRHAARFEPDAPPMMVMGRSANDCEQVLASLYAPARPILWALQGFLGGQHPDGHPLRPELAEELVIGHEEYRRVSFTEPHFRQAFTEVFRNRALLFLGSSLADAYLLDLFGQVLELSGPSPLPHLALVRRGDVDADFLGRRLGIFAVEYDDHAEVPEFLEALHQWIEGQRPRVSRWSFDFGAEPADKDEERCQLSVVRSQLPVPGPRTCLALSAGLGVQNTLWVSDSVHRLLCRVIGRHWAEPRPRLGEGPERVVRIEGQPVFLCAAREEKDRRHLRTVSATTEELLDDVSASGEFDHVRMQLLAVGRSRVFPAWLSLTEICRAAGRWFREHPESRLRLSIHVVAPDVLHDISAGRIDLNELLACDDLRLWVEVRPVYGAPERQLVYLPSNTLLRDLAARFVLLDMSWRFEVLPSPMGRRSVLSAEDLDEKATIADLGLAPGMTLRLYQDGAAMAR